MSNVSGTAVTTRGCGKLPEGSGTAARAAGEDDDDFSGVTRRSKKCLHTGLIGGGGRNWK